jgi:DNA-binding response OmpR family regulator
MGRSILIAEDNPHLLEVLALQFDWRGYRVLRARDGVEALAQIEQGPDVLLLDVVMPRKNGYEVCRSLKSDPQRRGLPVILVSGRKADADREWGLECGADAYVTKPFGITQLELEVEKLLARQPAALASGFAVEERPAACGEVACRWTFDPLAARVYRQKYGELAHKRLVRELVRWLDGHLAAMGMHGWKVRCDYQEVTLVNPSGAAPRVKARIERLAAFGNDFLRSFYGPEDAALGAVVHRDHRQPSGGEVRYPLLKLVPCAEPEERQPR